MEENVRNIVESAFRQSASSGELFDALKLAINHRLADVELYKILLGNPTLSKYELIMFTEKICKDSGLTREELEEMIGEVQVVEGVAHKAILEAAQRVNADVIIMGSHGQTVIGKMLGSVAHKVVMNSKVPVLLVPIKSD